MSLEDIDVSEWPTLRFGGSSVRLKKGTDYLCVSRDASWMGGYPKQTKSRHDHILTLVGLEKIVELTDDPDMRAMLQRRLSERERREAGRRLLERDPEKVAFRKDIDRLRRIHMEGNG